jgi:hypothetical protein
MPKAAPAISAETEKEDISSQSEIVSPPALDLNNPLRALE